ncbi:DUF3035 domain-containing protein [Marivita hallyeonensis]|uniref:Beta-barrel assembly machine subunit BamF n=1 Tax=Marivita hallyeonensis TaxID=996342 RepID=A0A1M5THG5_9RHOB|nr:DUF3035 domain-containing protein [Marivita hallyeonensis]SHH50090.1 Beta-barrel assembly machine subunit BamF [Marivita hallyeonensis]
MPRTLIILALVVLTACSSREESGIRETNLKQLRNPSGTPEEFSIVPNKPLETPESFAQLPPPTPGGANRTDQTPLRDAVAALGGSPSRLDPQAGIGAGDQALVARASRFGRQPGIREDLAAEDQEFRERRSLFNWRLVPTDTYNRVYRSQRLDSYRALDAARRAGVLTPSAPPQ